MNLENKRVIQQNSFENTVCKLPVVLTKSLCFIY